MSRLRRFLVRVRDDDRGAGYMAAFIVLFGTLVLGGVGVLVDSARIIGAERHASASAFEAARAGAQALDGSTLRAGGVAVDATSAEQRAAHAAATLLAGSDAVVESVEVTETEVIVTISRRVDPWFPVLHSRTVRETGRARLAVGIVEEGQ